jgi:hypothetical protein
VSGRRGYAALAAALAAPFWPASAKGAGALETLTDAVARGLASVPAEAVVVAAPLASDQQAPKGDELAERAAALLAGRIGHAARAGPQTAQLATARALSAKAGGLVYLQLEIAKGELRATADLYPVMRNAWDRIRNPVPSPSSHAFAGARIDAEVRAFLTPILLEQATVHKVRHDEGDVLALACGDVDEDGGLELALVTRARVTTGRIRGGKFVPEHAVSWADLAPRVPVPMREPVGTAFFATRGGAVHLFAGTTERGGVALGADFTNHQALPGLPLPAGDVAGCVAANAAASALEGPVSDCSASDDAKTVLEAPTSRFDAFAAATIVARDGGSRTLVAAREPGGRLHLRFGPAQSRTVDGAGAQVAVGDLDEDGVPEIATTANAGEDVITIQSWAGTADAKVRLRIPAPAGVRALATCPPEDRGAPALVAAVGHEVWLVR